MDIRRFLLVIAIISIIGVVHGATVTDSMTIDNTYWTAPSDVSIISLDIIGAGGSATGGVYAYQNSFPSYFYTRFTGIGGFSGSRTSYSNIAVTPGESYLVRVGMPGVSQPGVKLQYTGTGTITVPTESSASQFAGGTSSILINGVTYSSPGGHGGNYTITYDINTTPYVSDTNSGSTSGWAGYVTSEKLAYDGESTAYGAGAPGGTGYGAGGGGGSKGGDQTATDGDSGSGGVGAQGIVQITYNTGTAREIYPQGYVRNASGIPISGASVEISQLTTSATTTTDSNGFYSIYTGGFLLNTPTNITISNTGYETDINRFSPIASGGIINTTLLDSSRSCTPPCIDGVVNTGWEHSAIPNVNMFVIENITRAGYQTNLSTSAGYYRFPNLTAGVVYDTWCTKLGYSNCSVHQVLVGL